MTTARKLTRLRGLRIAEISLVPAPANPGAVVVFAKTQEVDVTDETVEIEKARDLARNALRRRVAANRERMRRQGAWQRCNDCPGGEAERACRAQGCRIETPAPTPAPNAVAKATDSAEQASMRARMVALAERLGR